MSAIAERMASCEECGRRFAACRSTARFCGATCRSRWNRRRSTGDLDLARLARDAVRAGCDPLIALSIIVWPPETADEARRLFRGEA